MKYHLLALVIVAIWGLTFISTKVLILSGLTPAEIFFVRFILAYLGMLLFHLVRRIRWFSDSIRDELKCLLLGVCGGSVYFLTENTALRFTQASNASFLVSTAPLLTLLLTAAYLKVSRKGSESGLQPVKFTLPLVAGAILATLGMALVVFSGVRLKLSPKGDLLALGAALCWAIYSLLAVSLTKKYGSVFVTRKVFFYGILTIVPVLAIEGSSHLADWDMMTNPKVLLNLLFLGAIASLMCYLGWNVVMSRLGHVTASNYNFLNPFFTLIGAAIFLGERMTPMSAIGCVLIFLGVWCTGRHMVGHSSGRIPFGRRIGMRA